MLVSIFFCCFVLFIFAFQKSFLVTNLSSESVTLNGQINTKNVLLVLWNVYKTSAKQCRMNTVLWF